MLDYYMPGDGDEPGDGAVEEVCIVQCCVAGALLRLKVLGSAG